MKYMLLLYGDPARYPAPGTSEFEAMMQGFFTLEDRLKDRAKVLSGEGLPGTEAATTLRLRAGRVAATDGLFAETREHPGGNYVVDVPNLDAALTYAALLPVAHFGTIELRPLMDYNPAG